MGKYNIKFEKIEFDVSGDNEFMSQKFLSVTDTNGKTLEVRQFDFDIPDHLKQPDIHKETKERLEELKGEGLKDVFKHIQPDIHKERTEMLKPFIYSTKQGSDFHNEVFTAIKFVEYNNGIAHKGGTFSGEDYVVVCDKGFDIKNLLDMSHDNHGEITTYSSSNYDIDIHTFETDYSF
ncbi:MAG: hypothetical protein J0G32_03645 [Alphaproteobacteria bacterium]|mgnify:CR=1 FL=1|nr:hypothetical protein [Alphaproteobacteria bacterium]OJV13142.1 MAG: hypothetical protein BGO27_02840 [Alphaproteobacteria bacterium 33-17]